MAHPHHDVARALFAAMSTGDIPDDLLAPDMEAWTTSGGAAPRERFQMGVRLLASIFDGGLTYTVDSLTAEDDRVAAEVRGSGTLANGERYDATYLFMLRVRDGRVAALAEHNNPVRVNEQLMPLMREKIAGLRGG